MKVKSGYIIPTLGKEAFSCPNCGALAHQTWYFSGINQCAKGHNPWVPVDDVLERVEKSIEDEEKKRKLKNYYTGILKRIPITFEDNQWENHRKIHNITFSKCYYW
ncbi:hypothetical protein [Hoeflea sp. IMCC20628]|uniref:hypothetical protein n=1 Tax=Hoeflea sp. IMCC20628 TaxID=1620421 RepID=UPI0012E0A4F6|nr:hypothetical protein [Hoeflea sp. IMCC20628]